MNTDEPLVALWAKWHALEWRRVPEGMPDDEQDNFNAQSADQADEVAIQIVSAPAQTVIGAYAQIALLENWAVNGTPDRVKASLKGFHGSIVAALQDAAREEGGAS